MPAGSQGRRQGGAADATLSLTAPGRPPVPALLLFFLLASPASLMMHAHTLVLRPLLLAECGSIAAASRRTPAGSGGSVRWPQGFLGIPGGPRALTTVLQGARGPD